jgi:uncharacterized Zn-finger protein
MQFRLNKTKLHECAVCKKKYSSKMLLTEHMNLHTGTRPYACSVCGKTFASKYTHQAHLKTHSVRDTYIPLTHYPRRGSRGISDIPPRHPRFTKIS